MERIHEPARELDVIADADVVVIGGGPGGIPAAVAAATTMVAAVVETEAAAAASSPLRWWSCWCSSVWGADSSPAGETKVLSMWIFEAACRKRWSVVE